MHQLILFYFAKLLDTFSVQCPGQVFVAPYRVRVADGVFREPDILFVLANHLAGAVEAYCDSPDLVVEVVSADDPNRDWVLKRGEYARANIPEYWIIDPQIRCITVLRLDAGSYVEHSVGGAGQTVSSAILPGFTVDVAKVFQAGTMPTP